ncbi:hypothetical protein ACSBR2_013410 [Camellia fascicularis]
MALHWFSSTCPTFLYSQKHHFSCLPLFSNAPLLMSSQKHHLKVKHQYFIRVKSIKINEKIVPLNTNLLTIHNKGHGGTKISIVNPYTILETSIYKAITEFFINKLSKDPRVATVAPFRACFNSKNIGSTRVGPVGPTNDIVLQRKSVF